MTDPLVAQLIEARKAAGLTQRQLADRMCCVQSHVSMLEAGRTSPTVATVRRWAEALGLRVALVPQTAPPGSEFPAGHGAPRRPGVAAADGVPASAQVEVGSDLDRADVAPVVGFFVGGEWCGRCGDQNYDPVTKICLTCTYPDDPCSRAYLDANPLGSRPIRPAVARGGDPVSARSMALKLAGSCVCDSRYDGCEHDKPCGQPNDGSNRGPWCAECNPRRLDHISNQLRDIQASS